MDYLELLARYEVHLRPFLKQHSKDRFAILDGGPHRLNRLPVRPDSITICVVGIRSLGRA